MKPRPPLILDYWIFGFAACAFGIYMLLLWRGGQILEGRRARRSINSLSIR